MEKKTHTDIHTHTHTNRTAPRKDVLAHIYVSLCLAKGSISTPPPPPPNAKSHNGISDGKNVLSSDDGQIEGEYSQMSKMINGRVQRQDHTHTHTNTGRQAHREILSSSLALIKAHMQIRAHTPEMQLSRSHLINLSEPTSSIQVICNQESRFWKTPCLKNANISFDQRTKVQLGVQHDQGKKITQIK